MKRNRFSYLLLSLAFLSLLIKAQSQTSYCTPGISSCGGISITTVKFANMNSTSGCAGYADYSSSVGAANIKAGSFDTITVSFTALEWLTGIGYVKAWIDFDQNGIFEDIESFEIASAGSNATQSFPIRIPFNAKGGITRMRLRIENGGFQQMIPCTARTSGETEDYAVNIIASQTPNANFVVHVNQSAAGANDGTSWANAYNSLVTAFAVVKRNDTIKVAKGNYTPGYLLTSGVTYLGGYPNLGNPTNSDRNFSVNTTVLSGQEIFGYQLQNTTMLNGFIFENLASYAGFKAGIRLENANPIITNCVFRNNMYRTLYLSQSSPAITNCFFINNTNDDGQIEVVANSSPKIINCVFNRNLAGSLINVSNSNVVVKNCTFSNNKLFYDGYGIHKQAEIVAAGTSSATVANCIFSDDWYYNWNTTSKLTDSLNLFADNSSTFSITNSITSFNQTGTALLRMMAPKFKDSTNAAGADGFYFTADDGLQLINPCSPAMNKGLNSSVETTTDILGKQRIVSLTVDIGAYEIQTNPAAVPNTVYVNANANGLNDGTSWANAFTDLQIALAYCSDTIKVADGSYYPSSDNAAAFFEMQNGRVILGGYPNTGNPGNNLRNPALNQTILNGNLPVNNAQALNLIQATFVDSSAKLDGFMIKGAQAGAFNISYKASPVIKNCSISGNVAAAYVYKQSEPLFYKCIFNANAGGVKIDNSSPVIDSCSFIKNSGSAIINKGSSLSIIKNSSFFGNSGHYGGDIFNDNSSPLISNCFSDSAYVVNDYGGTLGGSMANINNSSPIITKCVFKNSRTGNDVDSHGGIIYNRNAKPYFLNCSFINAQEVFYNLNSKVKLEGCLGYGNGQSGYGSTRYNYNSFMNNIGSTADIINCNIAGSRGNVAVFFNHSNSILNIKNSILWHNNFNTRSDSYNNIVENTYQPEILNESSAINMSNSFTRIYGTNGINGNRVGIDPRFININDPAGADSLYGTADDGLQLCSCSPAINTALSIMPMAGTDITGSPRVFNRLDIGAYEYQSPLINTEKTFYVSSSASGANNGADWQNAYKNLHSAIKNACADTIKIMEGLYKPATNSRDSAFEISRKLYLKGGYQNSENPSEISRNPDSYPTILSGEIGNLNDTTDNSISILKINYTDKLVKVDGLTFSNSFPDNINGSASQPAGGGIYSVNNKNLVVNNCRFSYNRATLAFSAGGVKSVASHIDLSNSIFSKNYNGYGSVVDVDGGVISNSIFTENYSGGGSNVIVNGFVDFKNCLFYKNFAEAGGAGVLSKGAATFVNCNFIANTARANGAGLRNVGRAYLLNCIFNGNYTGNGIYADWYDYSGAPDGGSQNYLNPRIFDIINSVYSTFLSYRSSIINPGEEQFVDISNPIGPDNKWFTADDGLKLLPCSPLIDKGEIFNGFVLAGSNIVMPATDIMDSLRISGRMPDIGAYEYPGYFKPVTTIKATDSIICAGSSITFTATQTGLGLKPTFQWKVNGVNVGIDSSVFTTALLKNDDQVKLIVVGKDGCAAGKIDSSNTFTIKVNAAVAPSVVITTASSAICKGEPVTFTATSTNEGPTPVYQWQVNGVNAGANSNTFTTSALTNNDQIKVALASTFSCASPAIVTSNIISMTVIPIPVANAGSNVSVCTGGSVQLSGSGGDAYTWTPASGLSNAAIATPVVTPAATTSYILTVTNANLCSAKDTITVTINQPTTPTVSINNPVRNICFGTATTFTANAANEGAGPAYQWQVNGVNAGTNSNLFTSSSINNNDQVKVILTSNAVCVTTTKATSNMLTMAVLQLDTPRLTLNDKILIVDNPDAAAIYTWQSYASSSWSNVIPAVNGTSFTISSDGEYRVMAVKNPCIHYSQSKVANFRISTSSNPYGINLFPNPSRKIIILDSIKLSEKWESLDVLNSGGQPILLRLNITNQTTVSIDISSLPEGIYFVKLRRADGIVTFFKFVKL